MQITSGWTLGGAAALLVLALATGCGDGGTGETDPDYVIRLGNLACAETQRDFEDIQSTRATDWGESVRKSRRMVAESVEHIEAHKELVNSAPEELRPDLERYIAALAANLKILRREKSAAVQRRLTAYHAARMEYRRDRFQVHGLAKNVGLIKCGLPYALPPPSGGGGGGGDCVRSYPDVCLNPNAIDYDCASGEGDGPKYVSGPLRVRPPDPFGLDNNFDGIGCEAG